MKHQSVYDWNGEDFTQPDMSGPEEILVQIFVNGKPLVQAACSGDHLEALGIGFLYNAGLIDTPGQVSPVHSNDTNCVDIWTNHPAA